MDAMDKRGSVMAGEKFMTLYHFTSDRHIGAVLRDGLTAGVTLHHIDPNGRVVMIRGTQWLTCNPAFDQSWNEFTTLPYRRTDHRITLRIPKNHPRLVTWEQFSQHLPYETVKNLNSYGNPENWFLYLGVCVPDWFVRVDHHPGESAKSAVTGKAVG